MEFNRSRYMDRLIRNKDNSLIKVITGARRSGKSYLMNTLFYRYLLSSGISEKHIIRFAFDNEEHLDLLEPFFPEEPAKILQKNGLYTVNARKFRAYITALTEGAERFYLLLDEIQLLDSFVGTLNGFLSHANFDIYVTGSNSQMLSSEIDTKFRGRKISIHVLPLSFSEFVERMDLSPADAWRKYIVTGGIPIIYSLPEEEQRGYLTDLCDEVYLKDIIGRKGIRDPETLSDLFSVLASGIGAPVSPLRLERTFRSKKNIKVTNDTINRYIESLEDAFVVSRAYKYNIKGKAYINSPYKVYFEDIGVRNARLSFRQIEESHIMENIIYNELRYRGFSVDVGTVYVNELTDQINLHGNLMYRRTELEVDFVANSSKGRFYVQSCLNISDEETLQREIRSLTAIPDSFRKIIVTRDGLAPRHNENGVLILDIFDFLMDADLMYQ